MQLPFDWQGNGAGSPIVVPGPGAAAAREVSAFVVAGANDAEANPAIATNSANRRIAAFIFGNLIGLGIGGDESLLGRELYASF